MLWHRRLARERRQGLWRERHLPWKMPTRKSSSPRQALPNRATWASAIAPEKNGDVEVLHPEFAAKAADVIGLHLNPPQNALVLSVDEKPSIPGDECRDFAIACSVAVRCGRAVTTLSSPTSAAFSAAATPDLARALNGPTVDPRPRSERRVQGLWPPHGPGKRAFEQPILRAVAYVPASRCEHHRLRANSNVAPVLGLRPCGRRQAHVARGSLPGLAAGRATDLRDG